MKLPSGMLRNVIFLRGAEYWCIPAGVHLIIQPENMFSVTVIMSAYFMAQTKQA